MSGRNAVLNCVDELLCGGAVVLRRVVGLPVVLRCVEGGAVVLRCVEGEAVLCGRVTLP